MSKPQTLEEAWEELFATAARIPLASPAEFQSAARALARKAFLMGVQSVTRGRDIVVERRRIEELGK